MASFDPSKAMSNLRPMKDLPELVERLGSDAVRQDVMARLSADSFIRFRGHDWSSLISNPQFFKTHQESSYNRPFHLLISTFDLRANKQYYLSAQVNPKDTQIEVNLLAELPMQADSPQVCYDSQSVNGVVCAYVTHTATFHEAPIGILCPGSQTHLIVQPDPSFSTRDAHSEVSYQLGYRDEKEYLVLRMQWNFDGEPTSTEAGLTSFSVFTNTVGTTNWSELQKIHLKDGEQLVDRMGDGLKPPIDLIKYRAFFQTKNTVSLDGAIHWVVKDDINTIVAFDLYELKFKLDCIPLPTEYVNLDNSYSKLGGLFDAHGHVALLGGPISGDAADGTLCGYLWTYYKEKTSWGKKSINVSGIAQRKRRPLKVDPASPGPSSTIASNEDLVTQDSKDFTPRGVWLHVSNMGSADPSDCRSIELIFPETIFRRCTKVMRDITSCDDVYVCLPHHAPPLPDLPRKLPSPTAFLWEEEDNVELLDDGEDIYYFGDAGNLDPNFEELPQN